MSKDLIFALLGGGAIIGVIAMFKMRENAIRKTADEHRHEALNEQRLTMEARFRASEGRAAYAPPKYPAPPLSASRISDTSPVIYKRPAILQKPNGLEAGALLTGIAVGTAGILAVQHALEYPRNTPATFVGDDDNDAPSYPLSQPEQPADFTLNLGCSENA